MTQILKPCSDEVTLASGELPDGTTVPGDTATWQAASGDLSDLSSAEASSQLSAPREVRDITDLPPPRTTREYPRSAAGTRYGHAAQHEWLRGRLEYSESKREWKLRYIPIDSTTDQFGGSVIIANDAVAEQYRPGDFVEVTGTVMEPSDDAASFAPTYRVDQIRPSNG